MAMAVLRACIVLLEMETEELQVAGVAALPGLTPLGAVNSPGVGESDLSTTIPATIKIAVDAMVHAIQMAVLTRLGEAFPPTNDGGEGGGGVEQGVGPRRRSRSRSRSPRR